MSDVENNRLSKVSMQYDRDGKGYLDKAEQAMRDVDKSNKGFLSVDQIHAIVEDKMQVEASKKNLTKGLVFMVALVVLLAISNIGTAYLAVALQKETTTDANGAMVSTNNGQVVATKTTTGVVVQVDLVDGDSNSTGVHLCLTPIQVSTLIHEMSLGGHASLTVHDTDGFENVADLAPGTYQNSTHICFDKLGCGRFDDNRCDANDVVVSDGDGGEARRNLIASHVADLKAGMSPEESERRLGTPLGGTLFDPCDIWPGATWLGC